MRKFIYTVVFLHLLLVFMTIFHAIDWLYNRNSFTEKTFAVICSLNYSVWRYGFFTPDVGRSNEIEIKTYNVVNAADTLLQDLCARSVATRMMNLFPGVYKVSYAIRSIRYPSLSGFRNKEPVKTIEVYSTDFIAPYYFTQ